ncbi:hypothetical protein QE152_g23658 [Popillia japonica]|uniref:Uncharacterized protein n=1 Tax=Popillia japonica TaxID=7064 RepID=A0AAW1KGN0_POPJA
MKTQNPRIAKWNNLLNEFDYQLKFRVGTKMCHVVALSRAPTMVTTDDMLDDVMETFEVLQIHDEDDFVLMVPHNDPELRGKIRILQKSIDDVNDRTNVDLFDLIFFSDVVRFHLTGNGCENYRTWATENPYQLVEVQKNG